MHMIRGSLRNLPSIHENNQLTQRTKSKKQTSVQLIEEKLSQHQQQIVKNQKTIITLTNDFKIMKQQLKKQQTINQQKQMLYQSSLQQIGKISKKNKDLKAKINSLETTINQLNKQIQAQKTLRINLQSSFNSQNYNLINQLKQSILSHMQQTQKQKVTIKDLQNQINNLNKRNSQNKVQNKSSQQLKRIKFDLQLMINQNKSKGNKLAQMQRQNNRNKQQIKKYVNLMKDFNAWQNKFNDVKATNEILLDKNKNLQNQIISMQINNKKSKELQSKINFQNIKSIEKLQGQLQELKIKNQKQKSLNQVLVRKNQSLSQQLQKSQTYQKMYMKILKNYQQLKNKINQLKQSITCDFCKKTLIKPVTNIPCGHSYCLQCKKGYEKECKKCIGSSLKRQAVYRNQLLDQIILSYQNLLIILKILQ